MNDCSNAEIRDQLPDLLNDRLTVSARAAVIAHVDGCADCREELDLLRSVRASFVIGTPRVDVAHLVAALPKPPAPPVRARPFQARTTWVDWRVAAAVTMLAVGGGSVAVLSRGPSAVDSAVVVGAPTPGDAGAPVVPFTDAPSSIASSDSTVVRGGGASPTTAQRAVATAAPSNSGLGMSGHLADLDDTQLQALLREIEQMKALPITDPEPVAIRIGARAPASGGAIPDTLPESQGGV